MLNQIKKFIQQENLFSDTDKILLAVSGGIDSMVLAAVFLEINVNFIVAHCNFGLRAEDSENDETFVKNWAKQNNILFFTKKMDTLYFCEQYKMTIQEGARKLRYQWFEELSIQENCNFIATAHHQNDNLETILLNIGRGTGFFGVKGILPKHHKRIRPLLNVTKEQIYEYAKQNNILWREDSSNEKIDYQRNQIRHQLVPIYHQVSPNLHQSFSDTIERMRMAYFILEKNITETINTFVKKEEIYELIDMEALKNTENPFFYFSEYLKKYNFSYQLTKKIWENQPYQTGKIMVSNRGKNRLLIDRKYWIVAKKQQYQTYVIENNNCQIKIAEKILHIKEISKPENLKLPKNETYLDIKKIQFPFTIRNYKIGEKFCPLGMKGKSQKVSDFLTNQKLTRFEKENTLVIEINQKIAWIINQRVSEVFKCDENTEKVLHLIFE
ncbi:MAG: tRNA lysidine(34) synthetase TilS [Bacteroidetes bacterium]|nr:MAG: tRNA lysidine(34) synthetase TilS [Bacteroidota bacterium]TAG86064.1 MAG: tRNA lysidine(34) synthetase TilS [Bacteroidota bacterium]